MFIPDRVEANPSEARKRFFLKKELLACLFPCSNAADRSSAPNGHRAAKKTAGSAAGSSGTKSR
jgi:hypothetical protein